MNIALIADDAKKELMVQFCIAYLGTLNKHKLFATSKTGKMVSEATGLDINRYMSGTHGGAQQVASGIACKEVDVVFFFRDHMITVQSSDDANILRMSDVHNVPIATNIGTGEALIQALERGDLDWRETAR